MIGKKLTAFDVINTTLLLLFCVMCLYPFIYVAAISLNDAQDAARGGIYFWPRAFSLANYAAVFQDLSILIAYGVTIARVACSIGTQLLLCAAFAFALARPDFQGRKFANWLIVIPLYFWGGLIPYYMVLSNLRLLNSFWTYIIPALYSSFHIMVLRSSFKELPAELHESVRVDGGGDLVSFFAIQLPLIKPALAAIALFVGVGAWNDWYTGFTFITDSSLWCAQNVLLYLLQSNEASNLARIAKLHRGLKVEVTAESIKMAMLMVTTIPIVCIYPFLQKYFVKGVMIGSLKG